MLIKHNLSTQNDLWKNFWWSGGANGVLFKSTRDNNTCTFKATDTYTETAIGGNSLDILDGQYGLLKITNTGDAGLKITGLDATSQIVLYPGHSRNFKFKKSNRSFWFYLLNPHDAHKNNALTIDYVIISESDINVYLPHINNLPDSNKEFMPPEGDYKEIEPLRG